MVCAERHHPLLVRFACLAAALAVSVTVASAHATVTMDWVTVGNAGNVADPLNSGDVPGIGSVGYQYRIGKYEVTNAQYAEFLNAVAATDTNNLYSPNMDSSARGGITRSGSSGSYTYSVKANMADKPVNYVGWNDAARFANWMTNGQGAGSTETGVYNFTGAWTISGITRDLSNPSQVFLPTENEWYKAAFHQPASQGGDIDDYWLYATQSNSLPTVATATPTGDVANPGQDVVNYASGADWNGENGNVTTVGSAGSTSFYGAFDMNGNVWEWNETLISPPQYGLRAGSFSNTPNNLESSFRTFDQPYAPYVNYGFRVASPIPEPASVMLLALGTAFLIRRRRP